MTARDFVRSPEADELFRNIGPLTAPSPQSREPRRVTTEEFDHWAAGFDADLLMLLDLYSPKCG